MKVERFKARPDLDGALIAQLKQSIESGGALMLSGGNTPRNAYLQISKLPLRAARDLALLFSDDRYVPQDSPASNYRMASPLIESLRLRDAQVLRVRTELPLEEAAADYERQLSEMIAAQSTVRLGLLGLGADGHTASMFTPADLERARDHLAIAVHRPDGMQAVSVTPALLARVDRLVIVVTGQEKQAALDALLARDSSLIAWRALENCPSVEVWTA